MISIILPVYNVEKYLKECLDSILNQTFQEFEIICVNDGSDDCSFEILEDYARKHSKIKVITQNHLGVGAARNAGLLVATGKYVHFLDSDDTFEPEMFEELYSVAENNNLDMVVCLAKGIENGVAIEDNDFWPINKYIVKYNQVFNSNDCIDSIFNMFAPEPWSTLYKKELLLKNNIRFSSLSSSNGADLNYIARICADRIMILNKKFVNYRYKRENGITSKRNYINYVKARLILKDYLIKNALYEKYQKSYENNFKDIMRYIINNASGIAYENFVRDLKNEFADEYKIYETLLLSEEIKEDKFLNNIRGKKVVFWGASNFLRNYIKNNKIANTEVLGIVDKNEVCVGNYVGEYRIYSIDDLGILNPDVILVTIENNSKYIYPYIKEYVAEHYPDIQVAPNIFE